MSSSYQVFARKYRPKTFADLLGQDHVTRTLRNAVENDRIAQAYLFVGPRGTGKTSAARILAKALNCPGGPNSEFNPDDPLCIEIAEGRSLDVLEIDGASNNGVDQVRELRETVQYSPVQGRYKIYYIDEVHMLTTQAFNALLKTLEEPPAHVKFIFATTEVQKVLPTILSRCQRFDLRPIPAGIIANHLLHIAKLEKIKLSPAAAQAIARGADGGMRDAQSMLDQLVAFCGDSIEESHTMEMFGFTSSQVIADLSRLVLTQDAAGALSLVHTQQEGGRDLSHLLGELVTFFRNLLVLSIDPKNELPEVTPEGRRLIESARGLVGNDRLLELVDHLALVQDRMRLAGNKKLHLEMGLVKAVQMLQQVSLGDVVDFLRAHADGESPPPLPAAPKKPEAVAAAVSTPPPEKSEPAPIPVLPPTPPSDVVVPVSKATPSPAEPEKRGAPLSLDSLWTQAVIALERDGQGFAAMIAKDVTLLSFDDDHLIGGLPRSKEFEFALFSEGRDDLIRHLSKLHGRPVSLTVEIRDDIAAKEPADNTLPLDLDMSEGDPPVPLVVTPDDGDEDEEPPTPSASEPAAGEPELETPEVFYQDPLIEKALGIFDGTIVKES
ncbi:MAG: DNA polymerase III subunit gamma/tau [Verrucomicrobiales bacterium]